MSSRCGSSLERKGLLGKSSSKLRMCLSMRDSDDGFEEIGAIFDIASRIFEVLDRSTSKNLEEALMVFEESSRFSGTAVGLSRGTREA